MARFDRIDGTAPVVDFLEKDTPSPKRSAFNFTCQKYFDGLIGMIMPIDVLQTLPNEDYELRYDILARLRNPLVKKMLSGMRIYVHAYAAYDRQLWRGAKNFHSYGREGMQTGQDSSKPTLKFEDTISDGTYHSDVLFSPADYMGLPVGHYNGTSPLNYNEVNETFANNGNAIPNRVSLDNGLVDALPFVLYQDIYREYYMNKNLKQNNTSVLIQDEDDYILPYSCTDVNVLDFDSPNYDFSSVSVADFADYVKYSEHTDSNDSTTYCPLYLNAPRYRQFKGDYFNSSSPFADLLRGDTPTIDLTSLTQSIDWSDVVSPNSSGANLYLIGAQNGYLGVSVGSHNAKLTMPNGDISTSSTIETSNSDLLTTLNKARINSTLSASVTLNNLRSLVAYTLFLERNALTNGDYNELIKAQFGTSPKAQDLKPYYIGGFYQDVQISEVTQTSESSENSPLGTVAGKAISANSGYIGKYHSLDYGYIMVCMTIVPDVIYTNGIERFWTEVLQSEQYFPLWNTLAPMAIKNRELFNSGDSDVDEDVFAYTERFGDKKSRRNRAHNLIGASNPEEDNPFALDDGAVIMARRFANTPNLNDKFVTMYPENIDMNVFSVVNEPPFELVVNCSVDKVSPMPYVTVPGGLKS